MDWTRRGVALLDTVLDRTVLLGYSRLGYRIRQQGWAGDPKPGALRGKTAMVTGANSGIGKAVASGLAASGATVIMVARNVERGEQARDELAAGHPDSELKLQICDVSSLSAVRRLASELNGRLSSLDVVVHNAGVLPETRTETADGHELTLATHVLGPLLLTEMLRPTLAASSDPRVILMSSGGMYTQALPTEDPEYRSGHYRGATAYARTKRMQVALTPILAERWATQHISVYSMHPGWADTPGLVNSLPAFRKLTGPLLRTAEQGADTAVWLAATEPTPESGKFWHDRRARPAHYLGLTAESDEDRRRLWRYCAQAIGLDEE